MVKVKLSEDPSVCDGYTGALCMQTHSGVPLESKKKTRSQQACLHRSLNFLHVFNLSTFNNSDAFSYL